MKRYITHKNRTVPSTPYHIHTWCCFLGAMMVLLLSACPEPKTETQTENGENADDNQTASVSLAKIIESGTIPADLSPYNKIVQAVLAPYESEAKIVARYVTVAGKENKDGSAWEHAKAGTNLHTTLQDIDDASSEKVYLLLIGSGEYTVDATLAMKNHVAIVGGWDSWDRPADTHTILSGDNTRRVFKNNDIDGTAVLYGVVITKGKSAGSDGGGMHNENSSPVLTNVTFSKNTAVYNDDTGAGGYGSGMYNESSSPILTNVTFSGNTASNSGGGMNNVDSSPVLTNVTFSKNTADSEGGGGMYNNDSSPVLMNVTFSENATNLSYGGGMYNLSSSPVLTNVTFSKNMTGHAGGGMNNNFNSSPILTNVTFSGNKANTFGGGMNNNNSSPVLTNVTFSGNKASMSGGGMNNNNSSPTIVNCGVWGNTAPTGPQIYSGRGGTITFAYSVIDRGSTPNGITLVNGATAITTNLNFGNPSLTALTNNGGFVSTHAIAIDSSAINIGVYVRRQGSTFYYSKDKSTWYTGFNSSGLTGTINLPSDAIDLTATDATGTARTGRPDAGAYEVR